MSKVVFTADIHFGVPGRLQDTLFACRILREYCQKVNIDTIVVLGDLFHDRKALEIDVLSQVCTFFEETADEYQQTWIAFPGNHDMFLRHSWNINSLQPLRKHLTVIETVKILQLDDQRFWVVPFITYEKSYMRVIKQIAKHYQPGDKLLTHIGIKGATLNTCFLLKDWSIVTFDDMPFDRIYTGHFHSKQQIGENVWYPGSLIPYKFDEGDVPHGWYVYDLNDDTHKFINIWKAAAKFFPDETAPPQFCTVLDTQLEQLTEQDVKNNMVRIALQRDYTNDEKQQIRTRIRNLGAKAVRWLNLQQKPNEEPQSTQIHKDLSFPKLFKTWLDNDDRGVKSLDKDMLIRLNNEVIHDGDELYAVEESEV